MRKEEIARSLEKAFSQQGFAEPSVATLRKACNVSLRTLYKYYPSKEEMIVGALEYRHQRYLQLLESELPSSGYEAIITIFDRLRDWMVEHAPNGCMSVNAYAAFPDNPLICNTVTEYKNNVRQLLADKSQNQQISATLFLLHEGVSSAWPVMGDNALIEAKNSILQLFKDMNHA